MSKRTVSDEITEDKVSSWVDGDVILVSAPCGAGKSHFIKHSLVKRAYENGEKILMLLHRINCIEQFIKEMDECEYKSALVIMSYQSFEASKNGKNRKEFDFSQYKYIVIDEMHYFLDDSHFNKRTDLSLKLIMEQTDKIRIFMSATGEEMNRYFEINEPSLKTIPYKIDNDFSHIRNIMLYKTEDSIPTIIKRILDRKEKAMLNSTKHFL